MDTLLILIILFGEITCRPEDIFNTIVNISKGNVQRILTVIKTRLKQSLLLTAFILNF
jgi:hypothetical protein